MNRALSVTSFFLTLIFASCQSERTSRTAPNTIEREPIKIFPQKAEEVSVASIEDFEKFKEMIKRYDDERRKKMILFGMSNEFLREDSKNVSFTLLELFNLLEKNKHVTLEDGKYLVDAISLEDSYLTLHLGMHEKNQTLSPLIFKDKSKERYDAGKQSTTVITTSRNGINYDLDKLSIIYKSIIALKKSQSTLMNSAYFSNLDSLDSELSRILPASYGMDYGHLSPPN